MTNANVKAGYGFIPNGVEEKNIYYYHPDHLGSSSYITDKNGEVIQHTEYIAFGEVLVDEHSVSNKQPYLFNGKELDYETRLYYYGARYYDPKISLWLNTDPLSGYNPIQEVEHYIDGQHNGGIFNPMNMATYSYTYQNPVIYVDPNGKQVRFDIGGYIQGQFQGIVTNVEYRVSKAYNEVKQNVVNTVRQTQMWVKNNKTEIKSFAKKMQDTGDNAVVAGLGGAAVGSNVAAASGLAFAAAGGMTSTTGTIIEIGTDFITQDYSDETGKKVHNQVMGMIIDKAVDKAIPGPTPTKGMTSKVQQKIKEMQKVNKEMIKETTKKTLEKE